MLQANWSTRCIVSVECTGTPSEVAVAQESSSVDELLPFMPLLIFRVQPTAIGVAANDGMKQLVHTLHMLGKVAQAQNSLGNLFLDKQGAPMRALRAFEDGLATNPSPGTRQMLHSNHAYALALHTENLPMALVQVNQALEHEEGISLSGRDLLKALSTLGEPPVTRWQSMFEHIGAAVERDDEFLWTYYLDDLQRLLWYVVAHGQGNALRQAMEARQYPMKFSPLYHAFVAAIEGEDHLLKINPETRQAAMRIHEGLARRLKLYPRPR